MPANGMKHEVKKTKVIKNAFMLYIISISKLVFPILTLPYLTRVLSEDSYGLVTYVKSCMTYMHRIVDFGFLLSAVKDVVNANGDKGKIGVITGNTFAAKLILSFLSGIVLMGMCGILPILQSNLLFVALSFIAVAVTAFFSDFLFRGIEKMQYITIVYVISKSVSTALTFVLVKDDGDLLWIPVLDIASNIVAVATSMRIIHRLGIKPRVSSLRDCLAMLKDSFIYFLSNAATTTFSVLNTVIIGLYVTDLKQIAYWGVCLNIVSAIQGFYSPICNSVYPHMIKFRSLKFIHKTLRIFIPIVVCGCVFCFFFAKTAMLIIGGEKYIPAYTLFRRMIPILFFSFPAQLYGWPTLGAIGRTKLTTLSTVITAVVQVAGLIVMALTNCLTVYNMALYRGITEFLLMLLRMCFTYGNKAAFIDSDLQPAV